MRGCGGKTAGIRAIDIRSIYVYEFVTFETETGTVGDRDWLARILGVQRRCAPSFQDCPGSTRMCYAVFDCRATGNRDGRRTEDWQGDRSGRIGAKVKGRTRHVEESWQDTREAAAEETCIPAETAKARSVPTSTQNNMLRPNTHRHDECQHIKVRKHGQEQQRAEAVTECRRRSRGGPSASAAGCAQPCCPRSSHPTPHLHSYSG